MEEILIANLTLDTYRKNNIPPLVVPQGDYGARVIKVKITINGKYFAVESTAAVSIVANRKGDGISNEYSGKVNADGSVTVPITQWMLDMPGDDVVCNVVVSGNGYQYSTTNFLIEPQEKANPSEITPDDPRVDMVTEVLANENARQAAEETREINEGTRITAEDGRESAERQRITDEEARLENEAQRVSAEASREATFNGWKDDILSLPSFDSRITRNSKRITNLEQGLVPDPFETDDSVAYQKNVPINALPYAEISKIGGMTRKCANLVTYPYTVKTGTQAGVTITVNDSGSVVLNGTAEYGLYLKLCDVTYRAGVNYTLSGCPSGGGNSAYAVYDNVLKKYDVGSGITFTVDTETTGVVYIKLEKGQTTNNLTFYPMLNEGSTALPYELYYDGLRSAPVAEVKSVGANLLDYNNPYKLQNCSVSNGVVKQTSADTKNTIQFKIGAKQDTKIVRDFIFQEVSAVGLVSCSFVKEKNFNVLYFGLNGSTLDTLVNYNVSHLKNGMTYYLQFNVTNLNQGSVSWTDMGVYKHQQETFIPYVEHTLPIPAEVRPANGINETVYDYIEWETDVIRTTLNKLVDLIVIDGVNYKTAYQVSAIQYSFLIYKGEKTVKAKENVLCSDFPKITYIDSYRGARGVYITNDGIYVSFGKDSGIVTIDACNDYFKNNPTALCYELVTPEVTDISDLITSDNLIGVEGGGILTFENEYGYDVPSEVTYQLKGVTA